MKRKEFVGFYTYITVKGRRIYAKDYGKKAFAIYRYVDVDCK